MKSRRLLAIFATLTLSLASISSVAQPIIDDRFDDDDITTNTLGLGSGWNPNLPGGVTEEINERFTINLTSGAASNALLSKDTFTANGSEAIYGTFTFTEMLRPLNSAIGNGVAGWYAGFVDNNEPDVLDDGFAAFSHPFHENPTSGAHRGGLWIGFKQREDSVNGVTGALDGNEGHLVYTLQDQSTVLLEQWTWDSSVFEFSNVEIPTGRSDRVGQDLLVPLSVEISSDDVGYTIRFFSSDDSAILPPDMAGTWAERGVTDLSSLDTVRAVGFAGQNGGNANSAVTIELDRVYVDNAPQRDADDSGLVYTWGSRTNDNGNWSDTDGWQVGGANTVTRPDVVVNSRSADAVEVLSGTVRVATADQGAWSLQVNSGATLEVAAGRTLQVIDNEFGDATDIQAGGALVLGGTLNTFDINVDGTLTFADGTLRVDNGTIASLATSSDGTIANDRQVTVGQATLGAGDQLNKQRVGTLLLDQSSGANDFAAGSTISSQGGTVAVVNDSSSNALSNATVSLDGGSLLLSAGSAGPAAFDSPVAVNTSGTIRAGQAPGALANEAVTLGGANGIDITIGQVATLETADGYSMDVAGGVSGDGTLRVGDGANVNLSGAIAPGVLEFQGDTSNVTVGPTAVPNTAYQFSPTAANPAMVVDFQLTSGAGVVVQESEGVFTGSVQLNNGSNDYTGVTRIVSGTLIPDASGAVAGDYDGNGTVEPADYGVWQGAFGSAVTPGTGADGNNDGVVDSADYTVWRDNLGASSGGGSGLPAASLIQFEGAGVNNVAVVQTSQDFARDIGSNGGEVNWVGSGGFAAAGGGTVNVTLEGGAQLTWDSPTEGFNGQSLKLGSATADGTIVVTNDINLNNDVRVVELRDNQGSVSDVSEISGVISSSAGGADVLRVTGQTREFESGLLRLSGANTFTTLEIGLGTVVAEDGVGLPANANLRFDPEANRDDPMIFATSGVFDRNIGQGPGEVFWVSGEDGSNATTVGGFAAVGGDLTVTLEGGITLTPSDPDTGFNNDGTFAGQLQLGSPQGTGVVTFTNSTAGAAGGSNQERRMYFETFDNPLTDADGVAITGDHTNMDLFRIDGTGPVEATGTIETNNAIFLTNGGGGTLNLKLEGDLTANNNLTVEFNSGANVFVNGTASVDNVANARNLSGIGGVGTLFMTDNDADGGGNQRFQIQNTGFVRPGADLDSVGTLTVDLSITGGADAVAGEVEFQGGSIYEMEFDNDGGLVHDSLNVTSSNGFGLIELLRSPQDDERLITLELEALSDLTGLLSAGDEFDLITWNENVDVALRGLVINQAPGGQTGIFADTDIMIVSDEFDVSSASVQFEIQGDLSGRIYVTGLGLLGASSAIVPEPASAFIALLAAAAMGARGRTRRD